MIDASILSKLKNITESSQQNLTIVWFAGEESAAHINLIASLDKLSGCHLKVISSRWDLVTSLEKRNIDVDFDDFTSASCKAFSENPVDVVVFPIPKEKLVMHQLIQLSASISHAKTVCLFFGEKRSGIKTWQKKLTDFSKNMSYKKSGLDYLIDFTFNLGALREKDRFHKIFDSENYEATRAVSDFRFTFSGTEKNIEVQSKPGVFGWKKNDAGTIELIDELLAMLKGKPLPNSAIDLGCGSGLLVSVLASLGIKHCYATDNNAAAVLATQNTLKQNGLHAEVFASDAGAAPSGSVNGTLDLVVCNPPFHQGFDNNEELKSRFIENTRCLLKKGGIAIYVVNVFIPLEQALTAKGFTIEKINKSKSYKVITASRL